MELLPIQQLPEENKAFVEDPLCQESIYMSMDFYKQIGFHPPWICYYASENGNLVGSVAFKGKPVNNTVEIAYGTFEPYQQQGVGARMCRKLVATALAADPALRITARTLPEKNFSTRILEKNNFIHVGTVNDPDDGDVWEWEYQRS